MTSNSQWSARRPRRRREKRKSTSRTFTQERIEEKDTPSGKRVRKVITRRTFSEETTLIEGWNDHGTSGEIDMQDVRRLRMTGGSGFEISPFVATTALEIVTLGARRADGTLAPEMDGDYILDQVYSDKRQARWENTFLAQNGLFRASLDLVATGSSWQLTAEFSGVTPGPRWTAIADSTCRRVVLRRSGAGQILAAVIWPETVELTPLGLSASGVARAEMGIGSLETMGSMLGSVEP